MLNLPTFPTTLCLFTCWVPPFGKLGLWLNLSFAKKGGIFLYLWSFPLRCYPWIQEWS